MSSSELLTEDKWINDGTNNIKCKAGTYVYYDDNKKISECTLASTYQGFLGYAWYRGSVVKFNNSNVSEIIPVKDTEAFDFVIKKGTTLSVVGDNIYATIAQDAINNGATFAKDNEIIFVKSSKYIIKGRLKEVVEQNNIKFCNWIIRGTDGVITQGYLAEDTTIAEGVVFKAHTYVELNNRNIISGCLRDTAIINGIECVKNRYHLFYNDGTTLKVKLATINDLDYSAIEYDENGKVVKKYSDINYVKIDGYVFYRKGFTRPYELGYTTYKGTLAISYSATYEGGGSIEAPAGCEVIVKKNNATGEVTREFIPHNRPFIVNGAQVPLSSKIIENVTEGTSSVVLGQSITFADIKIPAGTEITYKNWVQDPIRVVLDDDLIFNDICFPKGTTVELTTNNLTGTTSTTFNVCDHLFPSGSIVTIQKGASEDTYYTTRVTINEAHKFEEVKYPSGTTFSVADAGTDDAYISNIVNVSVKYIIIAGTNFMSSSSGAACPGTSYYYKVSLIKGLVLNKDKKIISCYGYESIKYSSYGGITTTDGFRVFFHQVGYLTIWKEEKAEYSAEYDTWVGPVDLEKSLMSNGTAFATKDTTTPAKVVLKTINGVKAYVFISNSIYCGSYSTTWEFVSYDTVLSKNIVLATVNSGSKARKAFLVSNVALSTNSVVRGGCLFCADFTTKTSDAVCRLIDFKSGAVLDSAVDYLGD